MKIFITGASGHIGGALTADLLAAGHQVLGLARSDAAAARLAALGAEVVRGDLDATDVLTATAKAADGVVHLAYKHELALSGAPDGFARAADFDLQVVEALGEALAGSGKPLVGTGGTLLLAGLGAHLGAPAAGAPRRPGTEEDTLPGGPRADSENALVALADRGVRTSSVRLSPTVHSDLDHHGFIPSLIAMARRNGFSAYVGDGSNRWPAVHTRDAARLYRLAVERAPAGSRLHGVADEGVPFRAIAEAIGRGAGVPARSVTPADAPAALGFLAGLVQIDNPTSSARTQALLDWHPTHPGLLDDLAAGHYFAT
ncbi:MAG: SDR family oxidoreductase [Myxococcales bacterium]|nr:SDR family oxidoreductase [Myxococcales bacterium]